jgi:prepilin-type N-terminal cleavage/methylation domain-containing protein
MDRTLTSQNGLTLVELIVVVTIIGILVAIGMLNYRDISQVNSVNRDLNTMATFLQNNRMTAFTKKDAITVQTGVVAGTPFRRLSTSPDYGTVNTENSFLASAADFTINSRGIFSTTGNIRISGSNYSAARDCIAIANTRVRIGVWKSATASCDPE